MLCKTVGMARVAIIGGGSMGEAVLSGLRRSGRAAKDIVVAEKQPERSAYLAETYSVRVTGSRSAQTACAWPLWGFSTTAVGRQPSRS